MTTEQITSTEGAQVTTAQVEKPKAKQEKKAPAQKKAPAAKASSKGAAFFIASNRPASGALLKAHTAAFFSLYNMLKGGKAPLSVARAVLGDTAIAYHVKNARMVKESGALRLTPAGVEHFATRDNALDPEAVAAFQSVMVTGKPDGRFVKSEKAIAKIA